MEEFMSKDANATQNSKGQIVIYRAKGNNIQLEVTLVQETVWLTQRQYEKIQYVPFWNILRVMVRFIG